SSHLSSLGLHRKERNPATQQRDGEEFADRARLPATGPRCTKSGGGPRSFGDRVATMATLEVRSRATRFARPVQEWLRKALTRARANPSEHLPRLAMQKVVASSPIVRFTRKPRGSFASSCR